MSRAAKVLMFVRSGSLLFALICGGLWVGSGWFGIGYDGSTLQLVVSGGTAVVIETRVAKWARVEDSSEPTGWGLYLFDEHLMPWNYHGRFLFTTKPYAATCFGSMPNLELPLWMPAAGAIAPALLGCVPVVVARRRAKRHECVKCQFDLTGLAAGAVCPECGTARIL